MLSVFNLNMITQYEDYGKADHLEDGHLATDHGSARQHAEPREREWVYVDPHVMASPVAVGTCM